MRDSTELLTAPEVARQLRVSAALVYRWAKDGVLPAVRLGAAVRFDPADIDAFIERGKPQDAA